MKRTVFLTLVLLSVLNLNGQTIDNKTAKNKIKTVKASLKSGSGLEDAVTSMDKILKVAPYSHDASMYDLAGHVQQAIYEAENKKLYLKKSYDTLKLYNAYYNMFNAYMRCDSVEKTSEKFIFRRKNARLLEALHPNLLFIAQYFQKRSKWDDTKRFADLYLRTASTEMMSSVGFNQVDSLIAYARFLALESSAKKKDHKCVLSYKVLSESENPFAEYALEQLAISNAALNDTASMVKYLKEGVGRFPKNPYFFAHLIDYYNSKRDFQGALDYADEMVKRDSTSAYYLFVKGYVLQQMERYDDALLVLNQSFKADSLYQPTILSLGYCYFQKGSAMYQNLFQNRKKKNYQATMQDFYQNSRRFYELVRSAQPERKDLWYDWLYTIYYRLNLGVELQELENY